MWVFTGEFTIWMWCCSRKSARCSNRTIPEPSACFICCMPVSGNVHTQCKRQFFPWRIYNLNKQASQTLGWRKCYCIFYIFLYVWGKKERNKMSFKAVTLNPQELLEMLTIAEKSSDRVWSWTRPNESVENTGIEENEGHLSLFFIPDICISC